MKVKDLVVGEEYYCSLPWLSHGEKVRYQGVFVLLSKDKFIPQRAEHRRAGKGEAGGKLLFLRYFPEGDPTEGPKKASWSEIQKVIESLPEGLDNRTELLKALKPLVVTDDPFSLRPSLTYSAPRSVVSTHEEYLEDWFQAKKAREKELQKARDLQEAAEKSVDDFREALVSLGVSQERQANRYNSKYALVPIETLQMITPILKDSKE